MSRDPRTRTGLFINQSNLGVQIILARTNGYFRSLKDYGKSQLGSVSLGPYPGTKLVCAIIGVPGAREGRLTTPRH